MELEIIIKRYIKNNIYHVLNQKDLIDYIIKGIVCIVIMVLIELPFTMMFYDCQQIKYSNTSFIHDIYYCLQLIIITFSICYIVVKHKS